MRRVVYRVRTPSTPTAHGRAAERLRSATLDSPFCLKRIALPPGILQQHLLIQLQHLISLRIKFETPPACKSFSGARRDSYKFSLWPRAFEKLLVPLPWAFHPGLCPSNSSALRLPAVRHKKELGEAPDILHEVRLDLDSLRPTAPKEM